VPGILPQLDKEMTPICQQRFFQNSDTNERDH
jgi:hypothetical protein